MEEIKQKKNLLTHPLVITLCALLCCALWGSATPAIKTASALLIPVSGVPSTILFAGIRFFMAGIITIAIYSIARKKLLVFKKENLPRVLTIASVVRFGFTENSTAVPPLQDASCCAAGIRLANAAMV